MPHKSAEPRALPAHDRQPPPTFLQKAFCPEQEIYGATELLFVTSWCHYNTYSWDSGTQWRRCGETVRDSGDVVEKQWETLLWTNVGRKLERRSIFRTKTTGGGERYVRSSPPPIEDKNKKSEVEGGCYRYVVVVEHSTSCW